ncbi:MAG: hypothetical protein AAFX87_19970 [Bacteroidota bacterium]
MKKFYWNSEKIMSTSAIMISLMTLFVLSYQTKIIREQQRLSVLPYLSIFNENTGGPNFKLSIKNDGIGPAFIESVEVIYKDKTYETDLPQFLYDNIPEMDSIDNIYHSNLGPGQLVPPGLQLNILEVNDSQESGVQLVQLLQKLGNEGIDLKIVYRSIYEERWQLTIRNNFPEKLD